MRKARAEATQAVTLSSKDGDAPLGYTNIGSGSVGTFSLRPGMLQYVQGAGVTNA